MGGSGSLHSHRNGPLLVFSYPLLLLLVLKEGSRTAGWCEFAFDDCKVQSVLQVIK